MARYRKALEQWMQTLVGSLIIFQSYRRQYQQRLWLSSIGIMVGVASWITMWSAYRSIEAQLHTKLQLYGEYSYYLLPEPSHIGEQNIGLLSQIVYWLQEQSRSWQASSVVRPTLVWSLQAEVRRQQQYHQLPLFAVSPHFHHHLKIYFEHGYPLPEDQSPVCLLGHLAATRLLDPKQAPVGQNICIGETCLTVGGVIYYPHNTHPWIEGLNEAVIVSFSVLHHRLLKSLHLQAHGRRDKHPIWIANHQHALMGIRSLQSQLKAYYPFSDYQLWTPQVLIREEKRTQQLLLLILSSISLVAFVVGSVGIFNLIYSHVLERTPEIGIQKALGARPYLIQCQFLLEAIWVSLLGSGSGILLSLLMSFIIARYAHIGSWSYAWSSLPVALLFSTCISTIAAWLPASKAANLSPAQALQYPNHMLGS